MLFFLELHCFPPLVLYLVSLFFPNFIDVCSVTGVTWTSAAGHPLHPAVSFHFSFVLTGKEGSVLYCFSCSLFLFVYSLKLLFGWSSLLFSLLGLSLLVWIPIVFFVLALPYFIFPFNFSPKRLPVFCLLSLSFFCFSQSFFLSVLFLLFPFFFFFVFIYFSSLSPDVFFFLVFLFLLEQILDFFVNFPYFSSFCLSSISFLLKSHFLSYFCFLDLIFSSTRLFLISLFVWLVCS